MKLQVFVAGISLSLILGCPIEEKKPAAPVDSGVVAKKPPPKPKTCRLSQYKSEVTNTYTYDFAYADGHVVSAALTAQSKKPKVETVRFTYEKDRLAAVESGKTKITYEYDEQGKLTKLKGKGVSTRKLEYGEKGEVVKEASKIKKKPISTLELSYDKGKCPTRSKVLNKKGKVIEERAFEYDDKKNPFAGLGILINTVELMSGYAVGNCPHNVVKETSTMIMMKKKSKPTVREFEYEYNEEGYPTKITMGTRIKTLNYTCE